VRARRLAMIAAVVTSVAVVAAGCRKSEYHISAGAREKLSAVLTTINTDIAESCTNGPFVKRYPSDVAKAKQQLRELKAVGTNAADRAVMLLAAQMLRHVEERCTVMSIVDAEPNPQLEINLEAQAKACADELLPWLEGKANPFHLKQPCLKNAESRGPLLVQD
jgi:hypothetical protein